MFHMDKSKKMQRKVMITVAGILLLFIFSVISFGKKLPEKNKIQEKEEQIQYELAYLKEVTDEKLTFVCGKEMIISLNEEDQAIHMQIENGTIKAGDIVTIILENGRLKSLRTVGDEKINGKVLSAEQDTYVELEGRGKIPVSKKAVIYKIYDDVQCGDWQDIAIGCAFTDFVIKDGEICAALVVQNKPMENIRVLIKNSHYQSIYHEKLNGHSDCGLSIRYGREDTPSLEYFSAGQELEITAESPYFTECDRIFLIAEALTGKCTFQSIERSKGEAVYRGNFEIVKTKEGLVVINELPVEEYLYAVVPSEMPASYPLEALKAQAICARTYAYVNLKNPGYEEYGAHVDDSTGYQVYGNIPEREETTKAVQETCGQILCADGELINTYYYSTSCGYGSDDRVWNPGEEKKLDFLQASSISEAALLSEQVPFSASDLKKEENFHTFLHEPFSSDFEQDEPWYRWSVNVSQVEPETILSLLKERYRANPDRILTLNNGVYENMPVEALGEIKNISVEQRGDGGIVESIIIEGSENTFRVVSEYNIRAVLCMGGCSVLRQDGSSVELKSLLPSAFFEIETTKEGENVIGYKLYGGGYGHGAGMSQNAAKHMAEKGCTAQKILGFFYKNCMIEEVKGMQE